MVEKAEVVVVGGGAAGCATAYFLAKEGMKVVMVEREAIGSHASGFAFGTINPLEGIGIPEPLLPLTLEGLRLHKALGEGLKGETGIDTGFRLTPLIHLALSPEEREELRAQLPWQKEKLSVGWLEGDEVRAVEPRVSTRVMGGVRIDGIGMIESYRYVLALAQAAERYGAHIRHGEVVGLRRGVRGVVLRRGEVSCERVVLATGPWTGLGFPIPVEPLKGQILRLEMEGPPLACVLSWGGSYAATKADGLIWAGTTEERAGFDESPTLEGRQAIVEGLLAVAPSLAQARLVQQTACLRPLSADGLPIIGEVPGWEGVYLATGAGRKGILLSPVMGRIIADLITRGTTPLPMEPVAPGRFVPPPS